MTHNEVGLWIGSQLAMMHQATGPIYPRAIVGMDVRCEGSSKCPDGVYRVLNVSNAGMSCTLVSPGGKRYRNVLAFLLYYAKPLDHYPGEYGEWFLSLLRVAETNEYLPTLAIFADYLEERGDARGQFVREYASKKMSEKKSDSC